MKSDRVTTEMVREDQPDGKTARVWAVVKVDGEEVFRNVFLSSYTEIVDSFFAGKTMEELRVDIHAAFKRPRHCR